MTPEERDDLLSNAPPEENLAAKYEHLLHAFQEQGRIMRDVAHWLRCWFATTPEAQDAFDLWANMLDPPEPLSAADAAEKFSQDAAARKKQ